MSLFVVLMVTLGTVLPGCSPRSSFPWSLEGKALPAFKVVKQAKVSVEAPLTYSVTAVVAKTITTDDLTAVSQKIIQDLPKHELAVIFYYSAPDQISGPYTVGRAWWGVDNGNDFPPPGDYSRHVLKVDRK